ncbi:helix-turn-helix transcriptional regulator [Staphylococcus shinii]|nr:helix-turn-helix transcriptional regulator [Staphylococcus shinii]MDW8563860.1 helix-turn-helix transcriptional regulator [Staphylococcus shinii]
MIIISKQTILAKNIKKIRQSLGMSMEEFGKEFDVTAHKSLVSKWEKGLSKPNNERLKKIAELGNISIDELLYGTFEEYLHELAKNTVLRFMDKNSVEINESNYSRYLKSIYWYINFTIKREKNFFDEDFFVRKIMYHLEIEFGLGNRDLDSLTQYAYTKMIEASEFVVEYYDDPIGRKNMSDESINNFLNEMSKKYTELGDFINHYREVHNLDNLDE